MPRLFSFRWKSLRYPLQRRLGGLQNPPGYFGEENKFSFLLGFEPQFVECPLPSLVTVPSALLWHFSVLNKFNRVPRIPVVILNYTLFTLVNIMTAFLIACNWSPSWAIWIRFPFPRTVSPLSAFVIFSYVLLSYPLQRRLLILKTHQMNWIDVIPKLMCLYFVPCTECIYWRYGDMRTCPPGNVFHFRDDIFEWNLNDFPRLSAFGAPTLREAQTELYRFSRFET